MIRWLALLFLALLLWQVARRALGRLRRSPYGQFADALFQALRGGGPSSPRSARAGGGSERGRTPIRLVRCAGCGTHVPEAAARQRGGLAYCSEACERKAAP